MKAVAVRPGQKKSVHLQDVPTVKLGDQPHPNVVKIPEGRDVLVKTLQIGVDATDREINDALYGAAPQGDDYLIIGHESFGQVVEVGKNVHEVVPGDYVTCTVRRPGHSIYDLIGRNDVTSDDTYYERGINLCHGYMSEMFIDDMEYIVKVPEGLKHVAVLAEPASVCAKAIEEAYLAQRRLQVWRPRMAFVLGSGQIGILTTMILRQKGIEVYTVARAPGPHLKSSIVEAYGANYISTKQESLHQLANRVGKPDLIIEATGNAGVAIEAMEILAKNGALVWTSVTGASHDVTFDAAKVNMEWVLGNKLLLGSVNGNRWHFEEGLQALSNAELMFPGVTQRILTDKIDGLDQYQEMMELLEKGESLKVYVEVAAL